MLLPSAKLVFSPTAGSIIRFFARMKAASSRVMLRFGEKAVGEVPVIYPSV